MPVAHYRLLAALAASLSLAVTACGLEPVGWSEQPNAASTQRPDEASTQRPDEPSSQQASTAGPSEIDTEASIWTVLGLAKKESQRNPGPQTGATVSPILWQAALDTLSFVKFVSEDPLGGSLVTDWYSPPGKPNERYKVNVFILARTLHSDSLAVSVTREARLADGNWLETTVARNVETDLETAILQRAGQLKREWMATLQKEK
jgi:hypothetical protein